MVMSLKEFVATTGAEIVGDRLIVGELAGREFVGSIENGKFELNERGQLLLEAIEEGQAAAKEAALAEAAAPASKSPKPPKEKKAEAAPAPDALDDLDLNV